MNGYFITGTDTDVGKTLATAALLRALLDAGHRAVALKPVQTGCLERGGRLVAEDPAVYARFAAPYFPDGYPEACCRKCVPACSPHLAANDIYVCDVVGPMFVAILAWDKRPINPRTMLLAMLVGGTLGIAAAWTGLKLFSFAGVGISLALSAAALLPQRTPAKAEGA